MTPPIFPALSDAGQRLLADADRRDQQLHVETGYPRLYEIRGHLAQLGDAEREQLALDGLRWRHWWSPGELTRRADEHGTRARRDMAQASTRMARLCGHFGPAWIELEHHRAEPGQLHRDLLARRRGEYFGGAVNWLTGQPSTEGRSAA